MYLVLTTWKIRFWNWLQILQSFDVDGIFLNVVFCFKREGNFVTLFNADCIQESVDANQQLFITFFASFNKMLDLPF